MALDLARFTQARNWSQASHNQVVPIQPGGAVLVGHQGVIVSEFAFGKRKLWASVDGFSGEKLPPDQQEEATVDTIYDIASLTKLFTTVEVMRCVDDGLLDINKTVVSWLPGFAAGGKENVTLFQLLTHTSGLAPDPDPGLYDEAAYPTYESRIAGILGQPLQNEPGTAYVYSDLSFMTLMLVVEKVRGMGLDEAIGRYTVMLGMRNTYFNRANKEDGIKGDHGNFSIVDRVATQEFQLAAVGPASPRRPQPVRGTVDDENAFALAGVSGHAGLFSTVADTAIFCQMLLNRGRFGGRRVLSPAAVDAIFTDYLGARFPGQDHGLGFELNQRYTAGPMAGPQAASHTGFTGTSLVVERASNTFFILLANRVHPSRNWSSNNIVRQTLGAWVARALGRDVELPVRPNSEQSR
ncbi:hypothetical protein CDD83_10776 [Cordyceps sp. RAO-2017]|nr:hypothetical protein CDD83_10776 [Cordyceps sp. RAO-2017]